MYKLLAICGVYFPPEILFRKFLDSCLNQTLEGIKFIFVLDHPDDLNSRKILTEYKYKFENNKNTFIIEENEQNIGDIQTYIKTLKKYHNESKYVSFLDHDDFFDLDWFETLYKYAKPEYTIAGNKIVHYLYKDFAYDILENEDTLETWSTLFNIEDLIKTFKDLNNLDIYGDGYKAVFENFKRVCKNVKYVPLEEASFYHYVRHTNCMSAYTLEKDQKLNEHYNLYMSQAFYKTDYESTKNKLNNKININMEDIEKNILEEHSRLDKNLDNSLKDVVKLYMYK